LRIKAFDRPGSDLLYAPAEAGKLLPETEFPSCGREIGLIQFGGWPKR
jgi:hypothetical protein